MVVHGGWCIDGNDNLVNNWRWRGWESKKTSFEKKKIVTFSWIIRTFGVNKTNEISKKNHRSVLCLTLSFESILQIANIYIYVW